jgi:hypothetical protein
VFRCSGVNLPEIFFAQRDGRYLNVFAEASASFSTQL